MEFDQDSSAVINADFSVTYTDVDNAITVISGFPSRAAAESFCCFGDFDLHCCFGDFDLHCCLGDDSSSSSSCLEEIFCHLLRVL